MGEFVANSVSINSEKNINGGSTGKNYLLLETYKTIGNLKLDITNAPAEGMVIPAEDAIVNNKAGDQNFSDENAREYLNDGKVLAANYETNVMKLSQDIMGMFGLNYSLDEGTINEISSDASDNDGKGITPLNYLNYYLEGIAEDLEDLYASIESNPSNDTTKRKILSLAAILSAKSEEDILNLFRGFYFSEDVYESPYITLLGIDNFDAAHRGNIEETFRRSKTHGWHHSLINVINNELNGNIPTTKFNSREGSWDKFYTGGMLESFDEVILGNDLSDITAQGVNASIGVKKAALIEDASDDTQSNATAEKLIDTIDMHDDSSIIKIGENFRYRLILAPIMLSKLLTDVGISNRGTGQCSNSITAEKTVEEFVSERIFSGNYHQAGGDYYKEYSSVATPVENINKTGIIGGISDITHLQKIYAVFVWYVKFLQATLSLGLKTFSTESGPVWDRKTYQSIDYTINLSQIDGVIKALKGLTLEPSSSKTSSSTINLSDEVLAESHSNSVEQLAGIRSVIKRKKKQMLTKLNILAKNSKDINSAIENIILKFEQGSTSSSYTGYVNAYYGVNTTNFTLSRDAIGSATKYYLDHLQINEKTFPYSYYDKKDIKEYKQMYQVLSAKGYNLLQNEKMGRKNIINIGIPAGLVDALAGQAYAKSGDEDYVNSTLIAVYLHRKNELTIEEEVYPRPFVFDTAKYISNVNVAGGATIPGQRFLNVLKQNDSTFVDNDNLDNIISNLTYLMSDRNQPSSTRLKLINNGKGIESMLYSLVEGASVKGENYSDNFDFVKSVCTNHAFDYYLKMYQNLFFDLEFENYNFLFNNENLYTSGFDSDNSVISCRSSFKNFLTSYFPSFNVDIETGLMVSSALLAYDNLMYNNSNKKTKQLLSGNVFDRVFSIPYSDRDFIIRAGDYDDVYGTSIPNVHIDPKRQVTYLNNYTNMLPKEIPYAKGINDESNGAIYKFFVTVNILKKW